MLVLIAALLQVYVISAKHTYILTKVMESIYICIYR